MCEPATILAAGSLAIQAGSAIASNAAQDAASKANKEAALRAMGEQLRSLSLQEQQAQDATAQTIMQADRQARQAEALARVSAGEAGVSGASVEALIGDISADASEFKVTQERNLDMTIAQIQQEKRGVQAGAQSRINAVPKGNDLATALTIGAAGIDFASNYIRKRDTNASS